MMTYIIRGLVLGIVAGMIYCLLAIQMTRLGPSPEVPDAEPPTPAPMMTPLEEYIGDGGQLRIVVASPELFHAKAPEASPSHPGALLYENDQYVLYIREGRELECIAKLFVDLMRTQEVLLQMGDELNHLKGMLTS